jgi:hypothetical protein
VSRDIGDLKVRVTEGHDPLYVGLVGFVLGHSMLATKEERRAAVQARKRKNRRGKKR